MLLCSTVECWAQFAEHGKHEEAKAKVIKTKYDDYRLLNEQAFMSETLIAVMYLFGPVEKQAAALLGSRVGSSVSRCSDLSEQRPSG